LHTPLGRIGHNPAMRRAILAAAGVAVLGAIAVVAVQRYQRSKSESASATAIEAVRRVAKLTTVEMQLSNWHLRRDAKDLFGFIPIKCEKTVAVFYRGTVAAGFDLTAPGALVASVDSRRGPRTVNVHLPAARILYTDVPAPELVVADGSICNRVGAEDYSRMHTEARSAIEREAIASGVLTRAEKHARELVDAVVQPLGFDAVVTVGATTTSKAMSIEGMNIERMTIERSEGGASGAIP
jgi:hypothetical protein